MVLPWLHERVGPLLDRLWFGREFTPVEAVKHVLCAMQPATDEAVARRGDRIDAERDLPRRVLILLDDQPVPEGAAMAIDGSASRRRPNGMPLRVAVDATAGSRPLLSEDLALLRSLGSVFGFMLENVRLQRKRQEQEQVAQELRLQTSRSELKALRAQINPHFLFNALNAIASLIHTDPARADAAVEQLAEVFRYTLRRSEQEWAPLDQELAFARAYLDVEQARFGRRLEFTDRRRSGAAPARRCRRCCCRRWSRTRSSTASRRSAAPGRIDVRAARRRRRAGARSARHRPGPEPRAGDRAARAARASACAACAIVCSGHFGADAALELRARARA